MPRQEKHGANVAGKVLRSASSKVRDMQWGKIQAKGWAGLGSILYIHANRKLELQELAELRLAVRTEMVKHFYLNK